MTVEARPSPSRRREVFAAFLRLGLTAFGGPVAHLGFFHEEFVVRRRWLDEDTYADLVALCQFLPGPASSQVGMALGLRRAGLPGMGLAWLGFTLPSAVLMIAFSYGLGWLGAAAGAGWLQGLKLAAGGRGGAGRLDDGAPPVPGPSARHAGAAGRRRCACGGHGRGAGRRHRRRWARGLALVPRARNGGITRRAAAGWRTRVAARGRCRGADGLLRPARGAAAAGAAVARSPGAARVQRVLPGGSLVFGGGHVILPLLQAETVSRGLLSPDRFLAGYGAAQALPGPLSTFAGYLGASLPGVWGAAGRAGCSASWRSSCRRRCGADGG